MDKPAVAEINKQFFALSETFIHFYISNIKNFKPVCFAWRKQINPALFPFPKEDYYSIKEQLPFIAWYLRGGVKRIFNKFVDRKFFLNTFIERKIKLIHSHFGPVGWWALDLKRSLGIPMITSFYGYDLGDKIEDLRNWKTRRNELFLYGDMFLVEGNFMRDRLNAIGCPSEKIQVQRIAIPIKQIHFKTREYPRNGNVKLLFAGRFVEKKGVQDTLKAFHALISNGRDVDLILIGDGPLMSWIKKYIRENGLELKVHLMGNLPYHQYMEEMNRADLFIHPSCTALNGDTEGGAPTTILEAQACGLPVVSTTHADIPNVVLPGTSAILVREKNIEELTEAIDNLINHPEKWAEMGIRGREFVESQHDIEIEANGLESKYEQVLNKEY